MAAKIAMCSFSSSNLGEWWQYYVPYSIRNTHRQTIRFCRFASMSPACRGHRTRRRPEAPSARTSRHIYPAQFSVLLHDLSVASTSAHFVLRLVIDVSGNDGRVIVLCIVHRTFALILFHLLAAAVGDVGLLQQGVTDVFLTGEDVSGHCMRPWHNASNLALPP